MQRGHGVAHLTCKMPQQPHLSSAHDPEAREAAIRRAIDGSAPMPRDPVRTRILQSAGGCVAILAALQFATMSRGGRQA